MPSPMPASTSTIGYGTLMRRASHPAAIAQTITRIREIMGSEPSSSRVYETAPLRCLANAWGCWRNAHALYGCLEPIEQPRRRPRRLAGAAHAAAAAVRVCGERLRRADLRGGLVPVTEPEARGLGAVARRAGRDLPGRPLPRGPAVAAARRPGPPSAARLRGPRSRRGRARPRGAV